MPAVTAEGDLRSRGYRECVGRKRDHLGGVASVVQRSVFGSGVPSFRHSVDLKLLDAREFKTVLVALRYATAPQRPRSSSTS